jgi:hypothetical protein
MKVEMYSCEPEYETIKDIIPGAFTIQNKGKGIRGWVERKMLGYLHSKNILVQAYSEVKRKNGYTFLQVELEAIGKAICAEEHNLSCFFNKQVDFILCGGNVVQCLESFDYKVPWNVPDFYVGYQGECRLMTFHGMNIKVVPWFKGVLVVPKER